MTTERTSLKARIPAAIFSGLMTFRGVAAIVITAAALFSTVGAAQLSDVDELDGALPCHHLAGALAVDDCAQFNTLARKYASGTESALNCVGYVDNVQGELQASKAYLTAVELNGADALSDLQLEFNVKMQAKLEAFNQAFEAMSNLMQKVSATNDQIVGSLK
jgi:hypothetical protein